MCVWVWAVFWDRSDLCPRPPTTFHHRDDRERSTPNNNCHCYRNNHNFGVSLTLFPHFFFFLLVHYAEWRVSPYFWELANVSQGHSTDSQTKDWKYWKIYMEEMPGNWLIWPTDTMREDDKSNHNNNRVLRVSRGGHQQVEGQECDSRAKITNGCTRNWSKKLVLILGPRKCKFSRKMFNVYCVGSTNLNWIFQFWKT